MGSVANPALEAAAERAPVVVTGSKCSFDPFAKAQATTCGRTLGELTKLGVPYKVVASGRTFDSVTIHIGGHEVASEDPALLQPALEAMGYSFEKQIPGPAGIAAILIALLMPSALSVFTSGRVTDRKSEGE